MVNLQSVVDKTVTQLKEQGLLSGEALGQIFTSVSDVLNAEASRDQKDARTKVKSLTLEQRPRSFLWKVWRASGREPLLPPFSSESKC